jgi:hypothetical protein
MKYVVLLISVVISICSISEVHGQETRYRVEILVLTHLGHDQEPEEVAWLRDYTQALDFLTPPEEPPDEADDPEAGEATIADSPAMNETGPAPGLTGTELEAAGEEVPGEDAEEVAAEEPVVHIAEMSELMQEAWRRLRLSGPFRPEQFLAWEQGSGEPFPLLRLHDLELVLLDDPYADLRDPVTGGYAEDPSPGEDSPLPPTSNADPLTASVVAAEPPEPHLPPPKLHYRLDGTVMLRRSRFLHLDIDLELREAVYHSAGEPAPPTAEPIGASADYAPAGPAPSFPPGAGVDRGPVELQPTGFRVHPLRQSRQVRTERMAYFDSPVLGLLAFITEIEPQEENPE